jgi:hypothetical protein
MLKEEIFEIFFFFRLFCQGANKSDKVKDLRSQHSNTRDEEPFF